MTKLKTMKDLKVIKHDYCGMHCPPTPHTHNPKDCVDKKELKQEVIKHIKCLKKDWDNFEGCDASNDNVQSWIKYFFNIRDEDLK